MPRVLLLFARTSYRAEAFLVAARRLGVDVTVGSNHRQVLADLAPGSTLSVGLGDVDRSTATIVRFASEYRLAAIVAAEDDFTPLAAAASEALGLTHHPRDAVRYARDKALMRKRLSGAAVSSPWFHVASLHDDPGAVASRTGFPCVLKPLSLSASRGVIRADTPEEFVNAWHRIRGILEAKDTAGRGGGSATKLLIEAYLPGREVAVEGIVVAGELLILAILDKPEPMEGPFFEETILVTPSRFPDRIQDDIVSFVRQCAAHLGLSDGPIHAELRVDADQISLLEIAPRSIGGRCSAILRFDPEAALEELILRHALGMPVRGFVQETGAAGVMMLPIPRSGVLRQVRGLEAALEVPGIEGLEITIPLGQTLVPLPEGNRYLGFLFAKAETPGQVETALRVAHARIEVDIEPP